MSNTFRVREKNTDDFFYPSSSIVLTAIPSSRSTITNQSTFQRRNETPMFLLFSAALSTHTAAIAVFLMSLASSSSKTLFITGASSGIGAATAVAASQAGWNVALLARRSDKLAALVETLGGSDKALALTADVSDLASLTAAVQQTVEKFGGIDAAFANAGTGISKPGTEQGDPQEWKQLVDINIMGVLYTTRAVLPELKKRQGSLVLTGSIAGRRHIKGSIYSASKWFVHGYAGNMAEEMREWGGRCCVVAPGMVNTEFFDSPKPDKLQPEDVAQSVMHAITAPPHVAIHEILVMPQN